MSRPILVFVVLASAAALAGCADLPPLEPGVCGNGVIDRAEGEDCDSLADPSLGQSLACGPPEDVTHRCRYVCGGAFQCPVGWGCGEDGICRYPSSRYEPAPGSPYRADAEALAVGDLDGDGIPDVVAFSESEIAARFGSENGGLSAEFQMASGHGTGRPVLADLDNDGLVDVVAPMFNGVYVLRGQRDRTLAPVAYAPFEISLDFEGGVHLLPLAIDGATQFDALLFLFSSRPPTPNSPLFLGMQFQTFEEGTNRNPVVLHPETNVRISDLAGRIPVGDLDPPTGTGAGAEEFALPIVGKNQIWIYETVDFAVGAPKVAVRQTLTLPGGRSLTLGARFSDVNRDGRLDLMVAAGDEVAVALNDGTGKFGALAIDPLFDDLVTPDPFCGDLELRSARRWPLAVGDLMLGSGGIDVVTDAGIYANISGHLCPVAVASRLWNEAVIADFNRDGVGDVAAAAEGENGVDFFVGTGTLIFNPFRVDTEDPPFSLRVADFDGDLVNDLAIGEKNLDGQGLSVLFGDLQGAPHDPISMGRLQVIASMEPAHLLVGPSALDYISDMIVISQEDFSANAARSLAFLLGTSERRMLAPFVIDADNPVHAVLAGPFDPDDAIADLFAVTKTGVFLIEGAGGAKFYASGVTRLTAPSLFTDFEIGCVVWAAVDLDGDGRQEVVGVDRSDHCFGRGVSPRPRLLVARLTGSAREIGVDARIHDLSALGLTAPSQATLADVDADGQPDLVVTFTGERFDPTNPAPERAPAGSGVAIFWNANGTLDPGARAPTVLPALPDSSVVLSAVALNADLDRRLEIALSSLAGVWMVDQDDAGAFAVLGDAPVIDLRGAARMAAADLNGDGLSDLIFATRESVHVSLAIPHDEAIGGTP